ncbi:hypothetical protein CONLIGDRAFT_648156 [Coniochaeta ligniaria NRRL 30616]|uniref:Uncharacterized protein n=1 Tax=Coniochaeta ligniaria NRRL 30616 TaxID=1408157 RepID=A0A1J7ICB4_9PEZI|nr:hypothetical protein CONLIGDRAFT_648156 [Coniochaeta ligniaria NRRL 30616]
MASPSTPRGATTEVILVSPGRSTKSAQRPSTGRKRKITPSAEASTPRKVAVLTWPRPTVSSGELGTWTSRARCETSTRLMLRDGRLPHRLGPQEEAISMPRLPKRQMFLKSIHKAILALTQDIHVTCPQPFPPHHHLLSGPNLTNFLQPQPVANKYANISRTLEAESNLRACS